MLEVDHIPHTTPDSSTWYLVLVHPDRLQGIPRYIIQEGSGKSTLVPTALVCLCTFVLSAIVFLQRKSIPTGYAIFPKWSNSASKMSEISPPVGPFCHFDALNRI
jgi:hypothetical protein